MKKLKQILALLCVLAVLPLTALAAEQIDINRDVSFTVTYKDGEKPLSGARFDVYRVADTDADANMTVTEEFEPFSVDLEDMDQDDWQQLAMDLKGAAQLNLEPESSAEVDENGKAAFLLRPGLYLVIGSAVTLDEITYVCDPFITFVPWFDEDSGEWDYDIEAMPKHTQPVRLRKILKVWDPKHKEAWKDIQEISVVILCDGEYYDTAVLTKENGWKYEWPEELDPEHEHDWSFEEVKVDDFTASYEIDGETFTLIITNTYTPMVPLDEVPIEKKLTGNPSEKAKFTFYLKAQKPDSPMPEGSVNGVKEVTITGAGNNKFGKINFTKPGEYVYTITERNDGLKGYTYDKTVYTVTFYVEEDEKGLHSKASIKNEKGEVFKEIIFSNKYSEGVLPQTGLLWWPVPVLLAAGLLLVLMGVMRRKGNRDEE